MIIVQLISAFMFSVIYPITGELRYYLINLEWILVFIPLELALIFSKKIKTNRGKSGFLQYEAFLSIFLGYSFSWIFNIIGDYYIYSTFWRDVIINIGNLMLMTGVLFFIFRLEKRSYFYRKYVFSTIFFLAELMYVIFLFISFSLSLIFLHALWIIFILFVLMYFIQTAKNFYFKKGFEKYRIPYLLLVVNFFLLVIGYHLTVEEIVNLAGINIRLAGDILQLISLIFFSICLLILPEFTEYHWKEKIQCLYIVKDSGLFLYEKYFSPKDSEVNVNIISGWVTMIQFLLEEITAEKDIILIKKEKKTLAICPSINVLVIIICDEFLLSMRILLQKFIREFEDIYHGILENWNGDLRIFKPVDNLVEQFFF